MTTHRFNKGDEVAIFNNIASGKPTLEGTATVIRRLDTDHYYEVRFSGEPDATYPRFATARPGNEADDELERLRAAWRQAQQVPA